MNIGIIGSGKVGGRLGTRWAQEGHRVRFGVRDPQSAKARALIAAAGNDASAGALHETVDFGDVLVVALHWNVLPTIMAELAGSSDRSSASSGDSADDDSRDRFAGKIVIDATNRMYIAGGTQSASEDLADMLPGARVVKAFNSIGANNLEDPTFDGERPTMLIAGDDADAKAVVSSLAEDLGFEPVDAGPHTQSGALEALAGVWVKLSSSLGRDFAFRVIRR